MPAAEERDDAQQVKQRGDHGTGLSPDQSREINSLGAARGFGEGQLAKLEAEHLREFAALRGLDAPPPEATTSEAERPAAVTTQPSTTDWTSRDTARGWGRSAGGTATSWYRTGMNGSRRS